MSTTVEFLTQGKKLYRG